MQTINNILAFVIAVLVLVTIHEFGHFWVARRCKIKILRFSIGFGKPIVRWQAKSGTEYVVGILPLGGYVRMLDEADNLVTPADKPYAFNRKPVWQRFLVVLAGPLTNFLFAIIAFALIFMLGVKQAKPIIGEIVPNSIAAQAGLMAKQQLVNIDGKRVTTWPDVFLAVVERIGDSGAMSISTTMPNTDQLQQYQLQLRHWRVDGLNPKPLANLGIVPYRPVITADIANVVPGSAAARAGIEPTDHIVSLNGKPITDWYTFLEYVQSNPDKKIELGIVRNGQQLTLPIMLGSRLVGLHKIGVLGIEPKVLPMPNDMLVELKYGPLSAWLPAVQEVYKLTSFNFIMLGKMLVGQVSLKSLGGPITIFRSADRAFKEGVIVYLGFLALISIMLGFVNLLPIPGLDGGHILYYLLETIFRRPIPLSVHALTLRLGLILLVVIMVQATINDVLRLF